MKYVIHVPDLNYNLLSCATLEDDSLEGRWGKKVMKIMKDFLILFKDVKKHSVYICTIILHGFVVVDVVPNDVTSL